MRTRLNMFMLGRNGVDFLNKHLFRIAAIIAGLNLLFLGRIGSVPFLIAGYALFRTLSRNLPMRQAEDMVAQREIRPRKGKDFRCAASCEAEPRFPVFLLSRRSSYLRVPRGKGRIQVTCPRCGHRFDRKS